MTCVCVRFSRASIYFVKRYTVGSTTRTRQSGIEATSFYGKSVTSRQTTMTEQSCPSIRRTSNRINKKGKHTPETITIDDDSETEPEPELVRLFIVLMCACRWLAVRMPFIDH